jgi:DHA2 family multidrug resistance protein
MDPSQVPINSDLRGEGRIIGPKWPIALVSMAAAFIAVLDVSIVNVALPSIRASIGATLQDTSWIATGYMVSNIVVIPMTGFFQRRIGYRNYFAGSLVLFTLASVLCAFAWNLPSIVIFRMLQGMGGGALIPTASSVMLDRFPKAERNMAMATFGLGAMMGPFFGPSLGGWLTDQFSWHLIFLINLPIGILEIFAILALVREDRSGVAPAKVDAVGIALMAGWLGTMQYVLEEGNGEGWFESPLIIGFTLLSASLCVAFIRHELVTPYPVVQLRFFADRQYASATAVNMGLGMSMFAGLYLFSLFSGVILGFTATQTGNLILYAASLQFILMPLIGKFGGRFDARKLAAFGVAMQFVSLYMQSQLTGQEGTWLMLLPQLVRVMGMPFIFIPMSTLALDRIAANDIGDATGLFSLTRELGGSIGTALLATTITRQTLIHKSQLAENVTAFSQVAVARLGGMTQLMTAKLGGDPDRGAEAALASLNGQVTRQALILAFNDAFALAACIAIGMFVMVLFMRKPAPGRPAGAVGGH